MISIKNANMIIKLIESGTPVESCAKITRLKVATVKSYVTKIVGYNLTTVKNKTKLKV
jgi:DNA-binding NarL/FixJ family response regulator